MKGETTEFKEFKKIILNWESLFSGLTVTSLVIIVIAVNSDNFLQVLKENIPSLIGTFVATYLIVSIPVYVIRRFSNLKKDINDKLLIIDKCPRMVAFHTEKDILKKKIDSLENFDEHKWLLSKFISRMLTSAFKDFSFEIESLEYAKIAKDFLKEAKSSITLGGSFSPYYWLSLLPSKPNHAAPNKCEKEAFFNNERHHYPIDEKDEQELHSHFLSKGSSVISYRYVLLSKYDWKNLYLAERDFDEYYYLNTDNNEEKKLFTFYIPPDNHELSEDARKFFQQETALYDQSLLLKYNPNLKKLSCITDNEEIQKTKGIYDDIAKIAVSYDNLKKKIKKEKYELLNSIIRDKKIPHTLSYLFNGADNWTAYCEKEYDYIEHLTKILHSGLSELLKDVFTAKDKIKIVEIGSGTGDKISSIFDAIENRIISYTLIDVSNELLDQAEKKLKERNVKKINTERHILDICDENSNIDKDTIKDSLVLIHANSSLFTEVGFSYDMFDSCKAIFLTLDMYDLKKNYTKTDFYLKSHILNLLLHPLRAFEIPIYTDIIKNKNLLTLTYKDNRLKVYFKLKDYIDGLEKEQKPMLCKGGTSDYIIQRKKLLNINNLIVFDSLKFANKESIAPYFDTLGFKAEPYTDISGNFVAILLTKKENPV
jgi:hypothetical protein